MSTDRDRVFIVTDSEQLSIGHLKGYAYHLITYFNQQNIKKTDYIALFPSLSVDSVMFIAACYVIGQKILVLPTNIQQSEIDDAFDALKPVSIFVTDKVTFKSESIPVHTIPDHGGQNAILDKSTHSLLGDVDSEPNEYFTCLMTSGSTGKPKLVQHIRRNFQAAARSSSSNLRIKPGDQWLLNLPLNHIAGISIIIRSLLSGSVVRLTEDSSIEALANVLQHDPDLSYCSLVPTQLTRLYQKHTFRTGSNLKMILLGGGPISESLIIESRLRRIPVMPSFGMTETTAQCLAVPFDEISTAPEYSCGKPLPGIEAQLRVDPDDEESGYQLLWIKGNQVFKKYTDPDLTSVSFDGHGWFCTGDYASVDSEGYFRIIMRRTDRIVSGGENINPREVESALNSLVEITDVAVIGLPDDEWGQVVTAVVVSNHSVTLPWIKTKLDGVLPGFKQPKKIIQVNAIPRTASGKILRRELQKLIESIG